VLVGEITGDGQRDHTEYESEAGRQERDGGRQPTRGLQVGRGIHGGDVVATDDERTEQDDLDDASARRLQQLRDGQLLRLTLFLEFLELRGVLEMVTDP